jgi:hypothetical protein
MTISSKFRKQLAQEARDFVLIWRHASRYAKAGDSDMARRIIEAAPVSTATCSPEESAWCLEQAHEAALRIQQRDVERRLQGLPPFEPSEPSIH